MSGLVIYTLVAISIAITSYITIYKPAANLYIEITEDNTTIHTSIIYKIMWLLFGTIAAPLIGFLLLKGNNKSYIRDLVVTWLSDEDEDEDE